MKIFIRHSYLHDPIKADDIAELKKIFDVCRYQTGKGTHMVTAPRRYVEGWPGKTILAGFLGDYGG